MSEETRDSLRRLAAEGSDCAEMMLGIVDGPNVSPEVFGARMAEIDRATNRMPADAPLLWLVSGRPNLSDRDTLRGIEIPVDTTLRYEHRGPEHVFYDFGCWRTVTHRFRVVNGSGAGRECTSLEVWSSDADDCADLRYTRPFPPNGLEPVPSSSAVAQDPEPGRGDADRPIGRPSP